MLNVLKNRLMLSALAALALASASPPAQAADAATRGRLLALVACTYCHVVEENQEVKPVITIALPSFQQIADDPDTSAQSLRLFLRTQHTEKPTALQMPDPALNDDQIEDVVAFILSRRQLHRINALAPTTAVQGR